MKYFSIKNKTSGPSPRVGSPSGAMVYDGPRVGARPGLTGKLTWHHHATPKLTTRAATARGGRGEPHRWNRGQMGGLMRPDDNETKWQQTELGATTNGVRRRGEKESAR
jgi:hypothetical protein